jgi:hypothetical protein
MKALIFKNCRAYLVAIEGWSKRLAFRSLDCPRFKEQDCYVVDDAVKTFLEINIPWDLVHYDASHKLLQSENKALRNKNAIKAFAHFENRSADVCLCSESYLKNGHSP